MKNKTQFMNLNTRTIKETTPNKIKYNQYFFKGFQPSSLDEYFAMIPEITSSNGPINFTICSNDILLYHLTIHLKSSIIAAIIPIITHPHKPI